MTALTLVRTGCISVVLVLLSILSKAQPIADFTATPLEGCTPLIVNFTDHSTNNPTQWRWDLGNGTISFLQHPSVTYFNPGKYTVKLVVQNTAGIDSLTRIQYITVFSLPTVSFNGNPLNGCFPLPVQFSDLSSTSNGNIEQWQWDLGDGNISNQQNPLHTYTAAGNYNISLKVHNSNGCFKTLTVPHFVQISQGVHADFSNTAANTCSTPANINFTNLSTGTGTLTYLWNFGDGGTSTLLNPAHIYNITGNFTVQLIVTNSSGCTDTISRNNAVSIGNIHSDFSIADSICVGQSYTFTNTSTPTPASASWKFGDGTTSILMNPVKIYALPGTYQVKLINNFGNCSDSVTKTITVLPKPVVAFTANHTQACQAPFTVQFTNNSTACTSYLWNFGDGNTSTQIHPQHTYNAAGSYTVTLTVSNPNGCTQTLIKSEYIKIILPTVTIINLPQEGCAPLAVPFSSATNSIEPVVSYLWNFGDGTTSTLQNPTHIFTSGAYTITLTITTASGCTGTTTVMNGVIAYDKPVANFSATPRDVCASVAIHFTDLTTGSATNWLWYFGDGDTSTLQNPIHNYGDTGYMSVTLIVWNHNCADTITLVNYIHIAPPIPLYLVSADCSFPLMRAFTNLSIGADEWNWNFGDGTTSNVWSPVHNYATPGNYIVKLFVKNHETGCELTSWKTIKIVHEIPNFSTSDSLICRKGPVTFSATGLNPNNITSYKWNFGDGGTGSGPTVLHNYLQSGLFDVSLIIRDTLGCFDTIVKYQHIRVNGPTANFTVSSSANCEMTTVHFPDASVGDGIHPITQWIWNYGDGILDTLSGGPFNHAYTTASVYTIWLKIQDNTGCADSIIHTNMVTVSRPVAVFSADTLSCPLTPIHFSNNSTGPGLTYLWSFGDGNTGITTTPVHTYNSDGIYSVKLVAIDQYGCKDSISRNNYITIVTPAADFNTSDTSGTCPPLIVTFTNNSHNYSSLNWDFGDGNTSTVVSPTHFYNIPGNYTARLTITGPGGCTSIKEQAIKIRGPIGTFSYGALEGCKPLGVQFTANTQARVSFIWDFNDGTTINTTDSTIAHTYTVPGIYVPKMILLDAGGCVVPITGPDTIIVYGVTAGLNFNNQTLCNSGNVQFSNASFSNDLITSYEWNFGDGDSSINSDPDHDYDSTGLYYPTLIVSTQSGCIDSIKSILPVKIVASPQARIAQTADGCTPVTVTFNGSLLIADTSAMSWQWDFGNNHTSNIKNPPSETYTIAGSYPVNLLVTNSSGCMDTVLATVQAFAIPVVDAGVDTMICKGRGRTLMATGASSYTWTPSTGLSCNNCANPVATPDSAITYRVTGTTIHGCSSLDSVNVKVKYPFIMNNSIRDTLCVGSSLKLFASGAHTYIWSPAAGLDNNLTAQPTATPLVTTNYMVIGTDDKHCFSDTGYVPIKVYNYPKIDAGEDKTINVGQTLDLIPKISADVTEVLWSPTGSIFRSSFPSVTVKPRETTTYHIDVKNLGGCAAKDDITVNVICNGANVFIPNTFSPNGDGNNDIFFIRGTGLFRIKTARIFNRWGEVVFEKGDFSPNDASAGWDGNFKGQKSNLDVYIYMIEIMCDNNTTLVYKGNIALIK